MTDVYNVDCFEFMPTLEDNSIDIILTDPPYIATSQSYASKRGLKFYPSVADMSILNTYWKQLATQFARILKPSGFVYVFCDGKSYPTIYLSLYPHLKLRSLVWDKQTAYNGYAWRHQHELICFGAGFESPVIKTGDGDVIKMRTVKDQIHPAQKPVELLEKILNKHGSNNVVFDPFCGYGTTAIAARNTNNDCICTELDEKYYTLTIDRIQESTQTTLESEE